MTDEQKKKLNEMAQALNELTNLYRPIIRGTQEFLNVPNSEILQQLVTYNEMSDHLEKVFVGTEKRITEAQDKVKTLRAELMALKS